MKIYSRKTLCMYILLGIILVLITHDSGKYEDFEDFEEFEELMQICKIRIVI